MKKKLTVSVTDAVMKGTYEMILNVLLRGKSVVSVIKLDFLNHSVNPKPNVLGETRGSS